MLQDLHRYAWVNVERHQATTMITPALLARRWTRIGSGARTWRRPGRPGARQVFDLLR